MGGTEEEVRVGFPDSILTSDEQVIRHLHPHWKALIAPVFWLVVAAGAVASAWIFLSSWNQVILLVVTGLGLVAAAALAFWPWLRWRTTHYVFTNERVIVREGIVSRNGRDIPISRVNDVSFNHGIVERMLGCGTLTIESGGERGQLVLASLPQVEKMQSVLYELVEADRDRHSFDDADRDAIVKGIREAEGA
jgi:uncharacterized membrane protein YdbT with pleckstrin-like domain